MLTTSDAAHRRQVLRAYRTVLVLAGTSLGLLVLSGVLMARLFDRTSLGTVALQIPAIRERVIEELVGEARDQFDSHVDGDVGYVNLPKLEAETSGVRISTNELGIRERSYELPKPAGVVRIVFLGDSMVYGYGVSAEERLGAFLEDWLVEHSPSFEGRVECLHIGVPSWNFRSQCAYLRRQLSLLDPDLVVQISVPNDLEDIGGVRGFGSRASFSPQLRQRADSRVSVAFGRRELGFRVNGFVRTGVDYEGQSRYSEARHELFQLQEAVERLGGEYRLVLHFRYLLEASYRGIGRYLEPHQVVYLSRRFAIDKTYWNSESDPHWNREGHQTVAKLVYGLITRDDLLPKLNLEPWDEATATLETIAAEGLADATRELSDEKLLAVYRQPPIRTGLTIDELDATTASQIHGGVDKLGRVSPYASILLKNEAGSRLRLRGAGLDRPELDGARVEVFVDAERVAEIEIDAGKPLGLDVPLPAEARGRTYLSVRLEASDYVYAEPDLQHCVVFRLERLWIE